MVEESIDGSDAADGRRLPPNSPWLRVVSGRAGAPVRMRCGRGACGSPIFGPVRNRVMLRLTVLFAFLPFIFATKVARPVSGQREHRSTGLRRNGSVSVGGP